MTDTIAYAINFYTELLLEFDPPKECICPETKGNWKKNQDLMFPRGIFKEMADKLQESKQKEIALKQELDAVKRKLETVEESVKKFFGRCEGCCADFTYKKTFVKHQKKFHTCPWCKKFFDSAAAREVHVETCEKIPVTHYIIFPSCTKME